jgi:predicted small lipoprotein YifL
VKEILAMAAAAALAGLTACSVTTPVQEAPPAAPVQPEPSAAQSSRSTGDDDASARPPSSSPAGEAKEACLLFNSLFAGYAAVPSGDAEGYEDIYRQAEDAKDNVSGDLRGLFASLSLLAIDHSAAAASGGEPKQESKDAVRDAVFANAGTCTAEGITLTL